MKLDFAIPGFPTDAQSAGGQLVRKVLFRCARHVGKVHNRGRGLVTFEIDGAFDKRASDLDNARALQALMNCLCDLDSLWIRWNPGTPHLYDSVIYHRTNIWDSTPALIGRGFGDCKSLAACRIAELRRAGVWCRPVFRFQEIDGVPWVQTGYTMFHILIMFSDGTWADPSKVLGMKPPQEATG